MNLTQRFNMYAKKLSKLFQTYQTVPLFYHPTTGLFQNITIQGGGCEILNVQCSLGKLTNSLTASWESPGKYPFSLELTDKVLMNDMAFNSDG